MAKLLTGEDGNTHLRGATGTLCGALETKLRQEQDGTLTCPECAAIALAAIELSTKSERREWRKL